MRDLTPPSVLPGTKCNVNRNPTLKRNYHQNLTRSSAAHAPPFDIFLPRECATLCISAVFAVHCCMTDYPSVSHVQGSATPPSQKGLSPGGPLFWGSPLAMTTLQNAGGECFTRSARHFICTNASRDLSAMAEFLVRKAVS